jgi:MFS family permease
MPNAMSAPSFESLAARHGERYKWLLLLVVACGMIAGVLSTTSFSVAIPALTRHFGLGQSQVQWAITGFMAAMTIAMLPVAWLIDRFGFRVVFLSAISVLLMSSIAGSLTTSFSAVVAARIVQGAAAGMLQPLGPLAVMRLFPSTVQGAPPAFSVLVSCSPPPQPRPWAACCSTSLAGMPFSCSTCHSAYWPLSSASVSCQHHANA